MIEEFELLNRVRGLMPKNLREPLGLTDDAGLWRGKGPVPDVWATDTLVAGIDFLPGKAKPEAVGHKALAINLSDIAAMGACPKGFLITLGIPPDFQWAWVRRFYHGLLKLARQYRLLCLGGDITRAKSFFATIAVGAVQPAGGVVSRKGAVAGDWIGVTGELGGSILRHHLMFQPRIEVGRFLAENCRAHAMIDISDGLIQDLGHLLSLSKTGAVLETDAVPVSADAFRLARRQRAAALRRALTDGEDFELLFTVSDVCRLKMDRIWKRRFPGIRLSWIGKIVPGRPQIHWRQGGRPFQMKLNRTGFSHFQ